MPQPAKRKNTDSVPLSDLIGDDGELRHDADALSEKPKRKTDALMHTDDEHAARGVTDTQIFLRRFAVVLMGALGTVGGVLLLPYLPALIVIGGAAYLLRKPLLMLLRGTALGVTALVLFVLRLALSFVATIVVIMLTFGAGQIVPTAIATLAGFVLWAWVIGVIFGFVQVGGE